MESEEFEASLPRSKEGEGLTVTELRDDGSVVISDGERSASYGFYKGERLEGRDLRIVRSYTEAGWFMQAEIVKLTDGERTGFYVPLGDSR